MDSNRRSRVLTFDHEQLVGYGFGPPNLAFATSKLPHAGVAVGQRKGFELFGFGIEAQDRIRPFRSLASGLTRIGRHTRALAGSDVAKHHHHFTAIERTGLFQTVVLLELHEGLLGLVIWPPDGLASPAAQG